MVLTAENRAAIRALPEVLGDAAVLVEVGDTGALAGALAALVDTARRSAELAALGRSRAARFTWDRCAEGLDALYRDALAAGSG